MKIDPYIFANTSLVMRFWPEDDDDRGTIRILHDSIAKYTPNLPAMINIDGKEGLSVIFKTKPKL